MSQKHIENQFQTILGDYASKIDDDQLWSEIENRVPKKEKKRRFIIWFAFGLPVMALVLIGYWLIPNNELETNGNVVQSHLVDRKTKTSHINLENNLIDEKDSNESKEKFEKNVIVNKKIEKRLQGKTQSDDQIKTRSFENFRPEENREINETQNEGKVKDNVAKNDIEVEKINAIPNHERLASIVKDELIEFPTRVKKSKRPIKPLKRSKSYIGLNYYAGIVVGKKDISSQDERYINLGKDYISQGLSFSYSRLITSKLYGRILFSADKAYKKFSAQISRDTLVPSSLGNQLLFQTQYSNEVIDTEFGIPIVKGTYNRDVLNINTLTSMAIGIGIGYEQPLGGKWNVNLEVDMQRTFYYDISGLGIQNSEQKIQDLKSYENYFSTTPKYIVITQLNLDFALGKSVFLSGGMQYQIGMSSILIDQTNHSEKINLFRASLGLKKGF